LKLNLVIFPGINDRDAVGVAFSHGSWGDADKRRLFLKIVKRPAADIVKGRFEAPCDLIQIISNRTFVRD